MDPSIEYTDKNDGVPLNKQDPFNVSGAISDQSFAMHDRLENAVGSASAQADFNEEADASSEAIDYGEIFRSPKFTEAVRAFPSEARKEAIGWALQYSVLHPDGYRFWDFLSRLQKVKYNDKMVGFDTNEIADQHLEILEFKLGMLESYSLKSKERILRYCERYLQREGKAFHAFNGVFEDEIRENGLAVDQRTWDWEEMRHIDGIFSKAGRQMALGMAFENSERKLSYSESAKHTYQYGLSSPEWFAFFVAIGGHIPFGKDREEAFWKRDYALARDNVEQFCNGMMTAKDPEPGRKTYPPITEQEKQEVLAFFEKYWKKFTGPLATPKVALIRMSAIHDDWDWWCDTRMQGKLESLGEQSASEILSSELIHGSVDSRCDHSIDPKDIEIMDLPNFQDVYPEKA